MRVFSVEMLVKEEGAAVVEAALKRLKKETQDVAAEFKKTSGAAGDFGTKAKNAGVEAEVSGTRAAKAAIGFAAVGQTIARTGSLTADAGTRIIEAGSQVATMFGPGGLAVAALLAFAAAATSSFSKAAAEAKKMREEFNRQLQGLVNAPDVANSIDAIQQKIKELREGTIFGELELTEDGKDIININDGLEKMRQKITELRAQGFRTDIKLLENAELKRLETAVKTAEEQIARYQQALERLRQVPQASIAAPTPTAAGGAPSAGRPAPSMTLGARTAAIAIGPMPPFDLSAMAAQIPVATDKFIEDARRKAQELATDLRMTFQENIGSALVGGFVAGIEQAIASGSIGEGFKALGSMLLAGIGDAMIRFGTASLMLSEFMIKIMVALSSLNPVASVAASLALIGIGAALKGAARGMFGGQSGGAAYSTASFGGGSAGGGGMGSSLPTTQIIFGATSATTAAGMTPRSSTNITVIGPNDPSAQRAIQELMTKADSRGRLG